MAVKLAWVLVQVVAVVQLVQTEQDKLVAIATQPIACSSQHQQVAAVVPMEAELADLVLQMQVAQEAVATLTRTLTAKTDTKLWYNTRALQWLQAEDEADSITAVKLDSAELA